MARRPNRAVIEGNPRLIASSFLLVLHQGLVSHHCTAIGNEARGKTFQL
jgi:hypothetical protein